MRNVNRSVQARHLVVACLVTFALGFAQVEACSIERVGTTEMLKERGHFLAPVIINEKSQIQFLVDTGAERSSIDASVAAQLELPDRGGHRRRRIGTDGRSGRAYSDVTVRHLTLAGVEHSDFAMAVGDMVGGAGGLRGVIGADLMARYDVEFDYPNKRLNLYQVKDCESSADFKPWPQPYDIVALKMDRNTLSLPVFFDGKSLELALDTGAGSTKITMGAAAKLGLDVEQLKTEAPRTISHGSSGVPMANFARRFDKIQIGQSTYGNIEIKVSEIDVKPYDGLLGLDFLGSRKIWVSYATRQLLVGRATR